MTAAIAAGVIICLLLAALTGDEKGWFGASMLLWVPLGPFVVIALILIQHAIRGY